jgi:Protease subunit of ATP-dependent Clp proteases
MAKVKLYSVIGDFGATTADISAMLEQNKNEAVLDLYIMSPGGSVFDGIAIYNELKQFSGELTLCQRHSSERGVNHCDGWQNNYDDGRFAPDDSSGNRHDIRQC